MYVSCSPSTVDSEAAEESRQQLSSIRTLAMTRLRALLTTHATSAAMQRSGLAALTRFIAALGDDDDDLYDDEHYNTLLAGVLPLVTAAVTAHASDAAVCGTALTALETLALHSAVHVDVVMRSGLEVIADCMSRFPADAGVQRRGLRVLAALAAEADRGSKAVPVLLTTFDGLVRAALDAHGDDKTISRGAMTLYLHMARRVGDGVDKARVVQCVDAVAGVLARHTVSSVAADGSVQPPSSSPTPDQRGDDHVLRAALAVLEALTADEDVSAVGPVVKFAGFVLAVLADGLRGGGDVKTLRLALSVLDNLTMNGANDSVGMAWVGTLAGVMGRYPASASVQEGCLSIVWNLAVKPANALKLTDFVPLIQAAMKAHRSEAVVQEKALGAVGTLAVVGCNKDLVLTGFIDLLRDAMVVHAKDSVVQGVALATLANIADGAVEVHRITPLLQLVKDASVTHKGDAMVQQEAAVFFRNMSLRTEMVKAV